MARIKLYRLAHSRSGDKGEITSISLFPYREEDYDRLCRQVTGEAVKRHFGAIVRGRVDRYELPDLQALHFVLHGTRPGGVAAALDLDAHGKSLSWALLQMEIETAEDGPEIDREGRADGKHQEHGGEEY